MALTDIWKKTPEQLLGKTVQQVLAFAGNGQLRDGNGTSSEFREYLASIPSDLLQTHTVQCLERSFPDGGFALQDIVNQIGRRLGFRVQPGRYHGIKAAVGFDGLWTARDGGTILVEVKTSDNYRTPLETVADYRASLIAAETISAATSSILYVVGRDNTGELEAQIRGSRHAWDIRLISVEALLRLLRIKEQLDDQHTIDRIREILKPREFTRVDGIIDLVFSATAEAQQDVALGGSDDGGSDRTEGMDTRRFRDSCLARLQAHFHESLVKLTSTVFSTPNDSTAVMCSVSRTHTRSHGKYWFKFRPSQKEVLDSHPSAYVALGCGSEAQILLIPLKNLAEWLPRFNKTELDGKFYWHIHISFADGRWLIESKRGQPSVEVSRFLLPAAPARVKGSKSKSEIDS
jgi:hypothetical protein